MIGLPYRPAHVPGEVSETGYVVRRVVLDVRGCIVLAGDVGPFDTELDAYTEAARWCAIRGVWHEASVHPA